MGKTSEFSPLMNVLKRFFFYGAYIEKWGMVFWGESNKEESFFFFFFFIMAVTFLSSTTYLLTYSFYHVFSHISSFSLLIMNLPYADSNPSGRYGLVCVS